jgi:hypothetical protein
VRSAHAKLRDQQQIRADVSHEHSQAVETGEVRQRDQWDRYIRNQRGGNNRIEDANGDDAAHL